MCTVNVSAATEEPLAALLTHMRDILAEQTGMDPSKVLVGPVDFGTAS